jgi:hypothetical protein
MLVSMVIGSGLGFYAAYSPEPAQAIMGGWNTPLHNPEDGSSTPIKKHTYTPQPAEHKPLCSITVLKKNLEIIRCYFPQDKTVCYITANAASPQHYMDCVTEVEAETQT